MDPFYGKTGEPAAWIQWKPQPIYGRDGTCVGWLYGDGLFDVQGRQIGWSRGDHVLDQRGALVAVLAGARVTGIQVPQPGPRHQEPAARRAPPAPAFRRKANRPWPRTIWSKLGVFESLSSQSLRIDTRDRLARLRRWLA
jgi:hypothetical protein